MARSKNSTRQNIERDPKNPEPHLNSGYEDVPSTDFFIPSCGIEDADIALFNLFDKDIGFSDKTILSANQNIAIKKPFIIFATGERFAVAKRLRPPKDKQGQLMLPAISIRRTSFSQTADDITGRGMNQFTGNMVIKRKLDESTDRDYQNFINKAAFKNMDVPLSTRTIGEEALSPEFQQGGLLDSKLGNNVWEIITIPQPQFFTNTYEVVFWTNYTQHMNYLIETYIASFLPQSRGHRLNTDKGYWFISYTDENLASNENFDDFTEDSRVLRYTFGITVKGFILATNHETNMVPIRKHISSPFITFDSFPSDNMVNKQDLEKQEPKDKFVLTDILVDPKLAQTPTTNQKFVKETTVYDKSKNKYVVKKVGVLESNQKKGETVFYSTGNSDLEELVKILNS